MKRTDDAKTLPKGPHGKAERMPMRLLVCRGEAAGAVVTGVPAIVELGADPFAVLESGGPVAVDGDDATVAITKQRRSIERAS